MEIWEHTDEASFIRALEHEYGLTEGNHTAVAGVTDGNQERVYHPRRLNMNIHARRMDLFVSIRYTKTRFSIRI